MPEVPPAPTRPVPEGYRVEPLSESTTVTADDVLRLWEAEGAVPPDEALRRVHEVHMVATHETDGLVGVTSRYLRRNEQLGLDLWYGRVFTAAAHRQSEIALAMGYVGAARNEDDFVSGRDRRAAGMVIEVENEAIRRALPAAVWEHAGFTFIGRNARGIDVRVTYYAGAEVPGFAPEPPAAVPGARTVSVVTGDLDASREAELLAFWGRHGALSGEAARQRLPQVVGLLLDGDEIVGASSAAAAEVPLIGGRRLWTYRRFVPGLAGTPDDIALFRATFDALAERSGPGAGAGAAPGGVFTVVDERSAIEPSAEVRWAETGLLHAGVLPAGQWARLRWFDGAVVV